MTTLDTRFLHQLEDIVGAGRFLNQDALAGMDPGFHRANLEAGIAVSPGSTREVSMILSLCHEHRVGVVPQGGRTGLAGGAASVPGSVILMLGGLNNITHLDAESAVAVVEAGVTLEALDSAAESSNLTVGIDIAARGSATIGGMVSTNAGGSEAFRNGIMRHRVLGLESVLADGTIMSDLKQVSKANEGLDVKQLFIGAEGTLGVVTRCAVKLQNRRKDRITVLVGCDNATAAVRLFSALRRASGLYLLTAEIMWRDYATTAAMDLGLQTVISFTDCPVYVLFDVSLTDRDTRDTEALNTVLIQAMESGLLADAIVAKNESERTDMWRIREDSWAIDRQYPHGLWYDISVPITRLDEYVSALLPKVRKIDPALRVFVMGHLGDGNLHLTISSGQPVSDAYEQVARAVYDGLTELGGSFSAEHGIGLEKRQALRNLVDPGKLKVMSALKNTLDPHNIMNPGKILF